MREPPLSLVWMMMVCFWVTIRSSTGTQSLPDWTRMVFCSVSRSSSLTLDPLLKCLVSESCPCLMVMGHFRICESLIEVDSVSCLSWRLKRRIS